MEELTKISMKTHAVGEFVKVEFEVTTNGLTLTPEQAMTWAKILWDEAYLAQHALQYPDAPTKKARRRKKNARLADREKPGN